MIQQTIFPFKLSLTKEVLTARAGLAIICWWHNQRGQAENYNKELKIGFGIERMPCGQTEANAVFFRLGVIAYNLFMGFKRLACPETWVKHTIETFRWKMIQVAGRIVKHSGSVFLKIAAGLQNLELYLGIRRKIYELSLASD